VTETDATTTTVAEIRKNLLAGQPLLYLVSGEERRADDLIRQAADEALPDSWRLWTWTLTSGLVAPGKKSSVKQGDTTDPATAIERVTGDSGPAIYLFRDLHRFLDDDTVMRRLRDFYQAAEGTDRTLVILSSLYRLPLELRKETAVVDVPPPTVAELEVVLDQTLAALAERGVLKGELQDDLREPLVRALQGMADFEARHILGKVLSERPPDREAIEAVQLEKARLIRKEGVIQFVPNETGMQDVGGLAGLKDWLTKRRRLFGDRNKLAAGMTPRGLLMMGVSGCGKSLSVKAIADFWELPLFRLDMNEIYSGAHGSPEDSFMRALRSAEALAPCVLWVDEIEGGITGYESAQGGATWRIFSAFLTWMQEKTAPVFVAATANRIDLLPAEILRKGRFDQIFFLDLPSDEERAEIFAVHLRKRQIDSEQFDLSILAHGTKGWNGAEIEQCVVGAMVEAYASERAVAKEDLYDQLSAIVPLSTTMAEQIKHIRSWAHDRAIKASG